jgi:diguanylate cyclase (GGDEF)-like protein
MRPSILVISASGDPAVANALANDDVTVTTAIGTREGLDLAARGAMELVVIIALNPDAETRALVRRLRTDRHTSEVPVLVLDGTIDTRSSVLALETGATDWLPAVIERAELCATVRLAIRERRRTADVLERAGIDPLTGLGNSRLLERRLDEELDVWDRYHRVVSLVLLEIDGYAMLEHGRGLTHAEGVVFAVREVLGASARSTDVLFHLGSGRFAAVLRETPGEGARVFAERVRSRVETGTPGPRMRAATTTSLGIASTAGWRTAISSPRARLIGEAESALQQARVTGNACVLADPPSLLRVG